MSKQVFRALEMLADILRFYHQQILSQVNVLKKKVQYCKCTIVVQKVKRTPKYYPSTVFVNVLLFFRLLQLTQLCDKFNIFAA